MDTLSNNSLKKLLTFINTKFRTMNEYRFTNAIQSEYFDHTNILLCVVTYGDLSFSWFKVMVTKTIPNWTSVIIGNFGNYPFDLTFLKDTDYVQIGTGVVIGSDGGGIELGIQKNKNVFLTAHSAANPGWYYCTGHIHAIKGKPI